MIGKLGPTPAMRRARSACATTGSAAVSARLPALPAALRARPRSPLERISFRPRPSSCSRSPSTLSVCSRPRCTIAVTIACASSAVTRPRSTASFTTSSTRSRVSRNRLNGRMRLLVSVSRSSAALLPLKSLPAFAAAEPVWLARLRAVCWRPRARPPADAARLRAVLLPERLVEERREVELLRDDPLLLRAEALRDELDDEERRELAPPLDLNAEDRLLVER